MRHLVDEATPELVLISEADFIAAQDVNAADRSAPQGGPVLRRYLLAGLLACGACGRRMESAWSNGRPWRDRCRHGHAFAPSAGPGCGVIRVTSLLGAGIMARWVPLSSGVDPAAYWCCGSGW